MACHPREIFLGDGKLTWIHLFRVEQFELHVTKPTPEDVFELTGARSIYQSGQRYRPARSRKATSDLRIAQTEGLHGVDNRPSPTHGPAARLRRRQRLDRGAAKGRVWPQMWRSGRLG
jgi:hypothetical protein